MDRDCCTLPVLGLRWSAMRPGDPNLRAVHLARRSPVAGTCEPCLSCDLSMCAVERVSSSAVCAAGRSCQLAWHVSLVCVGASRCLSIGPRGRHALFLLLSCLLIPCQNSVKMILYDSRFG